MPRSALIVDPDRASCKLERLILRDAGWVVAVADEPELARRMLAMFVPDVVITDLAMKGTEHLAAEARARGATVVVVTAYDDRDAHARARAAGCTIYIRKPIETARFAAQIAEATGVTP